MHYLVYQIKNNKNGKIYIGCHQTVDLKDGYLGSGKNIRAAIKKYGIEAFTKTILCDFDSPEAMFAKEAELVTEEFVARTDTYNINSGGFGGWDYVNNSLMKNQEWKDDYKKSISKSLKNYYAQTPSHWIGRKHSPETIAKQKKVAKGKSTGSKNPLFGKKWMTNGTNSKPATKEEQEQLLLTGWKFGRTI